MTSRVHKRLAVYLWRCAEEVVVSVLYCCQLVSKEEKKAETMKLFAEKRTADLEVNQSIGSHSSSAKNVNV